MFEGCESVREELNMSCGDDDAVLSGRIAFLTAVLKTTKQRPLEQLLKANDISFEVGSKSGQLHCMLRKYIKSLQKAKSKSSNQTCTQAQFNDREHRRRQLACEWPQIPSSKLKHSLVQMFKDETSSEKLAMFTCVLCAESVLCSECIVISHNDIDLSLLRRPDQQDDWHMSDDYFDGDCPLPQLPFADSTNLLHDLMLDPSGVKQCGTDKFELSLCNVCHKKIMKGK
jgi:hypothetical protein